PVWSYLRSKGRLFHPIVDVQSDEFHLLGTVEDPVREKPFYEDSYAPKSHSRHQRQTHQNERKNDDVYQQLRKIIFVREGSGFIPRHVRIVVHRGEQRLSLALRQRS